MRRVGCFEWSIHFWVHILGLVTPMDFILHIFIILNGLNNLAMICIMRDHSKITKNAFLDDPNSQKWGFLDLGLMDRLDIAYDERTICFPTFGNTTRSWRIIQKSLKCIFEWPKTPKNGSLAVFLTQVSWIKLILHIMVELNVFQHLPTITYAYFCMTSFN